MRNAEWKRGCGVCLSIPDQFPLISAGVRSFFRTMPANTMLPLTTAQSPKMYRQQAMYAYILGGNVFVHKNSNADSEP